MFGHNSTGFGWSKIGGGPIPPTLGEVMAQAHYDRVIADGGVLPIGVSGLASVIDLIAAAYSVTTEAAFNTAVPVFLDPHYTGYKLGAGAGITAGQAARTVYAINPTSDVEQTTAASQPLLLAHEGVNYWFGSGVVGNFVSTPNAVANQITGDIEIIAYINYRSNSTLQMIVSKGLGSGNFCYDLYIDGSNIPVLQYSINGTTALSGICSTSIGSPFNGYLKVNRIASTGEINFYTSNDGITYTQLGTTILGTSGSLFLATSTLSIGHYTSNSAFNYNGKIYRATISNTIGGTPVVDFNPQSYNAATSQTQWTSATGEVWTINTGTATTGYKGVLVDRTIMQGDGVDDRLISGGLGVNLQYISTYNAATPIIRTGANFIAAISNGITEYDRHATWTNGAILSTFNGIVLNTSSISSLTQLITANFNGASSTTLINNANQTSGDTGAGIGDKVSLFGIYIASQDFNGNITTYIASNSVDNSTVNTAMYNIVRQMNNNAF